MSVYVVSECNRGCISKNTWECIEEAVIVLSSRDAWIISAVALAEAGVGIFLSAPAMLVAGGVATAIGVTGAIVEDLKVAKQRKMFRACELCVVKDKGEIVIYPSIISFNQDYILIDLPNGMGIKDVTSKHSLIESYCGRKVFIEQTSNRKVLIKFLDPAAKEQDRWLDIFNKLGIVDVAGEYPRLVSSEINKVGQKVVFKLPHGMIVDDFSKKQAELESAIKYKIEISADRYKLVIQTITRDLKDLYTADFRKCVTNDMNFLLGIGRDGEPLAMDLGGNEFSTLVCGASGSGKSVFLNCLMVQFILKGIEIRAIDLKAVEFKIFKPYKNMGRYATNRKDAIQVMADTFDLMQQRYKELEEQNCKSYADYNKKFNNSMPPVLLIIDEFSVLMGSEKSKSNFFLFELLSRCRAANILTIICTQTPRAKILDTSIRCNIKNTICFSCETDADSEVALGQKGNYRAARELKVIGRGFLKSKGKLIEFQGYFLEDSEVEKQIVSQMAPPKPKDNEPQAKNDKVIPLKRGAQSQDVSELLDKIDSM